MNDLTKQDLELLFDALEYLEADVHSRLEDVMMIVNKKSADRGDDLSETIRMMKQVVSAAEPELRNRRERIVVVRAKVVAIKDRLEAASAWKRATESAVGSE